MGSGARPISEQAEPLRLSQPRGNVAPTQVVAGPGPRDTQNEDFEQGHFEDQPIWAAAAGA